MAAEHVVPCWRWLLGFDHLPGGRVLPIFIGGAFLAKAAIAS